MFIFSALTHIASFLNFLAGLSRWVSESTDTNVIGVDTVSEVLATLAFGLARELQRAA